MLLRSLNTGVSGLRNFQTDLDVIGNNIANVDTTGFKKSRTNFEDLFSQNISSGTANVNPIQVGNGSKVSSIDTITDQGMLTPTNHQFDVGIQGQGYFQLTDSNGNAYYSRAGNFKLNTAGDSLQNSNGFTISIDDTNKDHATYKDLNSIKIDSDGNIIGLTNDNVEVNMGRIEVFTFNNPEGLAKAGDSLYVANQASGAEDGNLLTNGQGSLQQGYLENSNVDLTDELTGLIEAQRAYRANPKTITTSDQILQTLVNLKQ